MPDERDGVQGRIQSADRLAAVHELGLLDTPPEETFDALTRLAATLLRAPASFVSIVDGTRDFYKSQVGFPAELAAARQLSGRTFCHYTLDRHQPLVINDTHADSTWRAVPTVDSLGVRAYVGMPLQLEGQNIGSLCVIDTEPRQWNATELEIIGQLSLSLSRELNLRSATRQAREDAVRAQAMTVEKERLMAVVAHDLSTPLQVISLSAMIVERLVPAEKLPVVRRIVSSAKAMKLMIDELLVDNALAPVAQRRPERMPAGKLLRDACETMAPVAARAGIELVLGPLDDGDVSVDHAQLVRVFANLIGNATKYCPGGSRVVLSARRAGDEIGLSVADNGPGLAADELQRVFEAGWQGADGLGRGDGFGLGLSIVRTLVERNHGQVTMASQPGEGLAVTVVLKCAAAA